MTSSRSNTRPLGLVKANRGVVFPPLTRTGNEPSKSFKDHRLSIQGDGMVTHQRSPDKEETPRTPASGRPRTSSSDLSHKTNELVKDYQNREKQHKNRIQSLQKLNDQLRKEIAQKQAEIAELYIKLEKTEETYRLLYEKEKKAHGSTKDKLENSKLTITEKTNLIVELKLDHQKSLLEKDAIHEEELDKLKSQKDKEISERDEKINKLKMQMGSILKDNSWERQQQLEELSKELSKITEEANMLRAKLKKHYSKQNANCDRCNRLQELVDVKTKKVEEHELTIAHLMTLGKKVEEQLVQQDVLLKQFAIKKGYKTNYEPK